MNTKLTLTIEQSIIEKAKNYARGRGSSLSEIVENYFKALVREDETMEEIHTPIANSLRGSFKMPDDFDYKKELTDRLSEKYRIESCGNKQSSKSGSSRV